jgi:hypothetical protein
MNQNLPISWTHYEVFENFADYTVVLGLNSELPQAKALGLARYFSLWWDRDWSFRY